MIEFCSIYGIGPLAGKKKGAGRSLIPYSLDRRRGK